MSKKTRIMFLLLSVLFFSFQKYETFAVQVVGSTSALDSNGIPISKDNTMWHLQAIDANAFHSQGIKGNGRRGLNEEKVGVYILFVFFNNNFFYVFL